LPRGGQFSRAVDNIPAGSRIKGDDIPAGSRIKGDIPAGSRIKVTDRHLDDPLTLVHRSTHRTYAARH
jgi:hypothetical protein